MTVAAEKVQSMTMAHNNEALDGHVGDAEDVC